LKLSGFDQDLFAQRTFSQSQDGEVSGRVYQATPPLDVSRGAIEPALATSSLPIQQLTSQLAISTAFIQMLEIDLKQNKVLTVGDLASMCPAQIRNLRGVKQPKDGTVKSVLKRLLLKLEREGQLESWKNKAPVVDIPISQEEEERDKETVFNCPSPSNTNPSQVEPVTPEVAIAGDQDQDSECGIAVDDAAINSAAEMTLQNAETPAPMAVDDTSVDGDSAPASSSSIVTEPTSPERPKTNISFDWSPDKNELPLAVRAANRRLSSASSTQSSPAAGATLVTASNRVGKHEPVGTGEPVLGTKQAALITTTSKCAVVLTPENSTAPSAMTEPATATSSASATVITESASTASSKSITVDPVTTASYTAVTTESAPTASSTTVTVEPASGVCNSEKAIVCRPLAKAQLAGMNRSELLEEIVKTVEVNHRLVEYLNTIRQMAMGLK